MSTDAGARRERADGVRVKKNEMAGALGGYDGKEGMQDCRAADGLLSGEDDCAAEETGGEDGKNLKKMSVQAEVRQGLGGRVRVEETGRMTLCFAGRGAMWSGLKM